MLGSRACGAPPDRALFCALELIARTVVLLPMLLWPIASSGQSAISLDGSLLNGSTDVIADPMTCPFSIFVRVEIARVFAAAAFPHP